ncbi:MAG: RNA polymerase sporulation sigma factor SigH [Armatimonadetes bacterium]|nr:RNA polymerase sporulation sigma factor SigH [Armatimonadota bacterium]
MVNPAEFFREAATRDGAFPLSSCSDEELVYRAQQKNDKEACEYLLYKYRNLVRAKVKSYFLMGAERDDLLQIGMVGLWEAINDFRADRHTSFACFAKVCIQRQMISAVKAATRQKQVPLNSSISLEAAPGGDDDDERSLSDILSSTPQIDPETEVLGLEGERLLKESLREHLSPFEWRVLGEYRTGKSYKEMATALRCKIKSIDNALSRIRRKLPKVAPEQAARMGRCP